MHRIHNKFVDIFTKRTFGRTMEYAQNAWLYRLAFISIAHYEECEKYLRMSNGFLFVLPEACGRSSSTEVSGSLHNVSSASLFSFEFFSATQPQTN